MKKVLTEDLLKMLDNYSFKNLHLHHTWKPTHKSFTGNNHMTMQRSMKFYHVNTNKWSDIGQHLTLFPDGVWVTGRPFNVAPASITGWNKGALAIEIIGNFDLPGTGQYNNLGYDKLEGGQKNELLKLIRYFVDKYGESSVKFHRDHPSAGKTCPGTSLNKSTLIAESKGISNNTSVSQKPNEPPKTFDKEAWEWATKEKIFDGTRPTSPITREEISVVIRRLVNNKMANVKSIFPQITMQSAWSNAKSKGLVGNELPNSKINRAEVAMILYKVLNKAVS